MNMFRNKKIVILGCMFMLFTTAMAHNIVINKSESFKQFLTFTNSFDNIFFSSGVYKGNFYLRKTVSIFGNDKVNICGNDINNNMNIFNINSVIYGIKFKNSGKDIINKNSCVFINKNVNHVFIQKNFFYHCNFGIWLNQSNYNIIKKNIIIGKSNNVISNIGNNIQVFKNINTTIENNYILYGRDGIYISNSDNMIIKKNIFIMNRFGVHYMYSNNSIVNNNIILLSSVGIALMYSKLLDITNNTIYANKNHGILFRDILYSKIIKNKIMFNSEGIFLGSVYYNYIIHNIYFKNNVALKISNGSNGNLVYNNNFVENKLQIHFLDNGFIYFNGENIGNFWSQCIKQYSGNNKVYNKKFYITNISDWLILNYPILNIILKTPVMQGLKNLEKQFPSFRKDCVIDKYPLIKILN